ncbi:hypothetical protein [Archangium sp.]|uniref:hypothetical protein n=1 Tax=Archangium sp. TaxID=1872627 RepID=UPI002D41BBE0|nr:hypothetical protein [Archangium sp.]HYO57069.1 hypothetical protein [Archangium sp.]
MLRQDGTAGVRPVAGQQQGVRLGQVPVGLLLRGILTVLGLGFVSIPAALASTRMRPSWKE